jgi:cytoskeletal protein CcmA (bactofilin family)
MPILRKRPFFNYQQRAAREKNPEAEVAPEPPKPPQPVLPPSTPEFLRGEELRTSLSADAVVTGKLSFTAPTRIDGKLKGDVRCTDLLVIGPTAIVEGSVRADTVRIEGTVRGEIVETRKVVIRRGARVSGVIESELLALEDGGHLDARCGRGKAAAGDAAAEG